MITPENDIQRFFVGLGLMVKVTKTSAKRNGRAAYFIEMLSASTIDLDRGQQLLEYYFKETEYRNEYLLLVDLAGFSRDGHGRTGICRLCGCTEHDACRDAVTGSCWWVQEDLCSACATPEEIAIAKAELQRLFKKGGI